MLLGPRPTCPSGSPATPPARGLPVLSPTGRWAGLQGPKKALLRPGLPAAGPNHMPLADLSPRDSYSQKMRVTTLAWTQTLLQEGPRVRARVQPGCTPHRGFLTLFRKERLESAVSCSHHRPAPPCLPSSGPRDTDSPCTNLHRGVKGHTGAE